MTDQHNLEIALQSHFPIIVIETHEELRAVDLIKQIVTQKSDGLMVWSAGKGLHNYLIASGTQFQLADANSDDYDYGTGDEVPTADPETMLLKIRKDSKSNVIILVDFHPYLTDPKIVRLTREVAQDFSTKGVNEGNKLVLISPKLEIPTEIIRLCMHFHLSLPSPEQIHQLVLEEAKIWSQQNKSSVKADKTAIKKLVQNLRGLTTSDARRFIRNAIYNDGAITHSDVQAVMQAKYQLVAKDGALSFEYDTASFSDVGGFRALKRWLDTRKKFFLDTDNESRIDIPKGVMLLGVQGCGKSLAAKAIAGVWGVPLLRFDFGALYNKYIGETEKNIRDSLKSAETLSPCVLWIDEIEKGIGSDSDDSGTSKRVLGTLLTWMAENRSRVFLVATANDIKALPPELVRKGRLDEIFFVDLPSVEARKEIIALHLEKRELKPDTFALDDIAAASEGFSGAELEQIVVSARYAASADDSPVLTKHLQEEIQLTRPLSIVLAEEISQLREWAKSRTVSVD